jgi:hypothetical protein
MSNSKQTATSKQSGRKGPSPAARIVAVFMGGALGFLLNIAIYGYGEQPDTPTEPDYSSYIAPSPSSADNEGYNPQFIKSDEYVFKAVSACSEIERVAKAFNSIDPDSSMGCHDGVLQAKKDGRGIEIYNIDESRHFNEGKQPSRIALAYCSGRCTLEAMVEATGGKIIKNPNGKGYLISLSSGNYNFEVVNLSSTPNWRTILQRVGEPVK